MALAASSSSRSPSFSTPATSVPPSPKPTPLCETERLKAHCSMPQLPNVESRESKTKYVTGLVDQAVKSLCEIWRPQDIPTIFITTNKPTIGPELPLPPRRTHTATPSFLLVDGEPDITSGLHRNHQVPMKGFVHEVLRRSRTSGSVLQTALCYLEAIRPQVPELVAKEQSGEGTFVRYDSESRIMPATPAELALEAQLSGSVSLDAPATDDEPTTMDTVRVYCEDDLVDPAAHSVAPSIEDDSSLLPSPLLCPRRAFLASLILASKFTQDKCYSNRAWAKLSGLPTKEIGRCERALGDALDWRLWVGKTPATSQASSSAATVTTRPVGRCQSEASLPVGKTPSAKRLLRRSSTAPSESFAQGEKERGFGADLWPRPQLVFAGTVQHDEPMSSPRMDSSPYSTSSSLSHYSSSPIPPTPGLSYSPSSTESDSSAGDRTIQMSTFNDEAMVIGCGSGESWGAGSASPTLSGIAFEAALARVGAAKLAVPMVAPVFGVTLGPVPVQPHASTNWQWRGSCEFAPPSTTMLSVDYAVVVS
uniref:G1/S-specific cyclin pas1 n=1 Tax=Mycena chlorophos TaxID=658473 RepID=A0ABQ0L316_MYCCL|nr:predicted protein [Mycena chlorophos]